MLTDNLDVDKCFNSDDIINQIYNDFYFFYMLKNKNVHISRNNNYKDRKTKKPEEWFLFERLYKLCQENNFEPSNYIKYVIYNTKVKLSIRDFLNIKCIREYHEFKEVEQKYINIKKYIDKSINNILEICKENKFNTFFQFLKWSIKEQKLMVYVKGGLISRYAICLIPEITKFARFFNIDSRTEFESLIGSQYEKLYTDAKCALAYLNYPEYINIHIFITNKLKNDK